MICHRQGLELCRICRICRICRKCRICRICRICKICRICRICRIGRICRICSICRKCRICRICNMRTFLAQFGLVSSRTCSKTIQYSPKNSNLILALNFQTYIQESIFVYWTLITSISSKELLNSFLKTGRHSCIFGRQGLYHAGPCLLWDSWSFQVLIFQEMKVIQDVCYLQELCQSSNRVF